MPTTPPKFSPDDVTTDGRSLPTPDVRDALYGQFARIGQAIANPTRLHLLSLLDQGEKTVETLTNQSGHRFATVSAHLKVLRDAHLVIARRDGRHMVYRVADNEVARLCSTLRTVGLRALPEVRELADQYYSEPETMTPIDAHKLIERAQRFEIVLIDLRPASEYDAGHLPQARSIPFADLQDHLDDLPADKPIVAYCRGRYCVMAVRGTEMLRAHGLQVQRLPFGIADWRLDGHPTST